MNDISKVLEHLGLPAAIAVGLLWMLWRAGRALGTALLARIAAWFDTQIELGTSLIERNRAEQTTADQLQRGMDNIRAAGVEFCNLALARDRCEQLGLDPSEIQSIRRRLVDNDN